MFILSASDKYILPCYLFFVCIVPYTRSQAAATSALSPAERSYPMSEVRGQSWEDPMPEGLPPRGVAPCPRSGVAAKSARLRLHRNGREEPPTSEARGGGQEEQTHVQGAVAAWVQEGLEELSHVEGQEGWW